MRRTETRASRSQVVLTRGRVAELFERDHASAAVEDTHDGALGPPHVRQGDKAQVEHAAGDDGRDATVLRHTAFGNIETGADLQVVDDALAGRDRVAGDLGEHAVDADADPNLVVGRFDVDVAGSIRHGHLDGLGDHLGDAAVATFVGRRQRRGLVLEVVAVEVGS